MASPLVLHYSLLVIFGASRRVVTTAEQFSSYIKLLQHRAIVEMKPLGITITQDRYQTFRFEQGTWKPMPEKTVFHTQYFPSNFVVNLQKTGAKISNKNPDIVVNASGDMTPFILNFGTSQKPKLATLVGNYNGQISLVLPSSS
ncbi:type II secretion system protein GspH [Legionella hackeliae]|uniref:type II secretion system protein GspH n=1 Tax=Legionella hackeliae TaxID=449 RepID=UPI002114EF15|nr:type II secretion system protein GspH [Legionella hackeliae]